ncbi:MAG: DUF1552 domain-containing protein, partial [Acidobacteria bacterium]|nr:DUF1552 domain-containing protein [Acidobacteriota bacterium]
MKALSRRTLLRGTGVTMALPWLESLSGFGLFSAAAATPPAQPQRFAVLFMGTGISPGRWWAKGSGAELKLGESLAPLEPIKGKINVIDGLFNKAATGQGIHPAMTGNLLSGVPIRKGSIIHGGITIDQVLANQIGQETPQPSMVLACERAMTGFHETNFSNAYSSHISWQNSDSPVPNEMYPSLAFDSLFENGGRLRNTSVLDRVKEHAVTLSSQISSTDKIKLDEYLASVRDVERSIERMRTDKSKAEDRARDSGRPLFAMKRPQDGLPEDIRDHIRLMCDIVALGFQTDKTRVASLL